MRTTNKKYYNLETEGEKAALYIYGDITSYPWVQSDVSSYNLSMALEQLGDVDEIDVYINSYGGEVAEGLAIHNALKRHKAKVTTYCDGFACSIASVIFMAGDVRVMNNASLLMVHNAWTSAVGNADELRKQADDLDTITQQTINVYMEKVNISEEELKSLLNEEKWISPQEALEKGFATMIAGVDTSSKPSQSAKMYIMKKVQQEKVPPAEPKKEKTGERMTRSFFNVIGGIKNV